MVRCWRSTTALSSHLTGANAPEKSSISVPKLTATPLPKLTLEDFEALRALGYVE